MGEQKKVYVSICSVAGAIAKTGISKDKKNQSQGYSFRGIDDIYNAIAPLLSQYNLVIIPRVLKRDCTERPSKQGGILFNVVVEVEFDFISTEDGSTHTAKTFGEAMDSADKATNKAMSAAYKYAAFQVFCIPTEGDDDADAHHPEVKAKPVITKSVVPTNREADASFQRQLLIEHYSEKMKFCTEFEELKSEYMKGYRDFGVKKDKPAMDLLHGLYTQLKTPLTIVVPDQSILDKRAA